jgi:glycerol-3-phosphate acyltransferase PlsY
MDWLWAVIGFALGSLPLAVWVGKYGAKKDIRAYGDHNPGSINVIRAGGLAWGGLALMLEITKGALPVGLAHHIFGVDGAPLVAAMIAPPLGHAFSPFLHFKGGKALAAAYGTWIGYTLWVIPLVSILAIVFWVMWTSSSWAVMFTMATVLAYLLLAQAPTLWFIAWFLHLLLFIYTHRHDLTQPPKFSARWRRNAAKS